MDKNLEILKRLIIEVDEEIETTVDSETIQVKEKPKNAAFEKDPMGFILKKYNTLNEIMIELMTKDFREFVDAIFYIAPKPTTFKIQLHNGQNFFLTYMKDDIYEAIIGGKRYYLAGIGEKERCMMAISRLLRFGTPLKTKGAEGAEEGTRDNTGMEGDWAANGGASGGTETGGEEEIVAGEEETSGEELTENIKILARLLIEAKKQDEVSVESKILDLLNKDKNVSNYTPVKVQKASGNNYKVYFQNVNAKDTSARTEVLKSIIAAKGVKSGKIISKPVSWSSIGYAQLDTKFGPINISVKGSSENATSTNVKEGLVMSFYYSTVNDYITDKNFNKSVKAAISATKKSKAIEENLTAELVTYLSELENTPANIKVLNQPLSQAVAIKTKYPNYELDRSNIFNAYRSFAQQQLGFSADKWCPADLYVILNSQKAIKKLELASKESNPASAIEILNNAFNETWGSKKAPMSGISLKFEKAQGGKAKAYFEKYKKDKTEYNLTSEEANYNEKKYTEAIANLRKSVQQKIQKVKDITYELDEKLVKKDLNFLRAKFAALKAINFFFSQLSEAEYDDGLVALAAFGMSLSDTSPAFFKVTASTKGEGDIETFERGSSLSLLEENDQISPISIIDSSTFGGLEINMKVSKGGEAYSVKIVARSNGGVQGTIELQKVSPIK
jgi:hypothetical protein